MIKRKGGKTIIEIGQYRIVTTLINRHKYNYLRKKMEKEPVSLEEILLLMRKKG